MPKDDGSEKDMWTKRRFKTFIEALEDSNPGFHFAWDEQAFKGLYVGGLFREEQFKKRDGSVGTSTALAQVTTVEKVRTGKYRMPADKLLSESGSADADTGWMNVPEGTDEELPF